MIILPRTYATVPVILKTRDAGDAGPHRFTARCLDDEIILASFIGRELQFLDSCTKTPSGLVAKGGVIHGLDSLGGILDVGQDGSVPSVMSKILHPLDVQLT